MNCSTGIPRSTGRLSPPLGMSIGMSMKQWMKLWYGTRSNMVWRLIQRELYGVSPLDLTSFAVALTLMMAAALAACLIPACKAGHVDPIQVLNSQ